MKADEGRLEKGKKKPERELVLDIPVFVFVLLPNPPNVLVELFWPKPPLPKPNDMMGDVANGGRRLADAAMSNLRKKREALTPYAWKIELSQKGSLEINKNRKKQNG